MKSTSKIALIIALGTLTYSCNNDENIETVTISKKDIVENYANIVYQNYLDTYNSALTLQTTINTFTTTPNESNFTSAKDSWLASREYYGQTEAFRFASGPIDDSDGPEGLINAWPLDENYIDYVSGLPNSGIINDLDTYPTISKELLESLNEVGGEKNISVGYHAIEFLLWGQDLTAPSAKEPGKRPYTDYLVNTIANKNTTANTPVAGTQERRAQYINICSELLVEHLQLMVNEWKVGGSYRTIFLALDEDVALKNILTGISTLSKSELAGERIFVAYDNQDQEDEHSCFSDNTHGDIRLNFAGIKNVYTGKYGSISGASIEDLVTETNATLGAEISQSLSNIVTDLDATAIPFDFAISNSTDRPAVVTAVNSLRTIGDKFVSAATEIGISISAELPE
jgi:putative iron-regulated protein